MLNEDGGYSTLYLANLLATSLLTTALSNYVDRHPDLLEEPETAAEERGSRYFGLVLSGSIVLALIASLFWGNSAMLLLLLIPIVQRVVDRVTGGSEPVE